ncbi:cytochrome P450 2J6-like [Megalops cyprinoides]|uniref:cytochrome P450 2J6-like n=1 Tax=Megalops cyprinoides TaxID=118141 RepID=UPI001864719B|nr:cytochrome P450 2J6-like [Megalops cyprinoides]
MWLYSLLELDLKSLVLFLFAYLLITDFLKQRKPSGFPPGPRGLPFVGSVFSLDPKLPHIYLTRLAEVFGNVYSIRLGREKMVCVVGYETVKEALVTQADCFVSRPPSSLAERIYSGNGLFLSSGILWKKQRRFALSTLRNFGMGKTSLESFIIEESRFLQEEIECEKGNPFNPHILLNKAVSNIICILVFGRRFDYADHEFETLLKLLAEILYLEGTIWALLYESFPKVMKVLPGPHNRIFGNYDRLSDFLVEDLKRRNAERDPSGPRDYIDSFLAEMEKNAEDPALGFHQKNLILCALDLFLAGTETTSTTLRWALLFMIKYPHIQSKVQDEIDRVIGPSRPPSMTDRASMPYTNAVVHEVQRKGNILPLGVPHMADRDTSLGGYFIPKGTPLIVNLHSVLFDEKEWHMPDIFDPERFLDSNGNFAKKDAFLPFSAGKRVCLGEQLARAELFLFLTCFLQKFSFSPPPGVEPSLEPEGGGTMAPIPFKICAHPR